MNAMTHLRERVAKIVPSGTAYAGQYVDELSRRWSRSPKG